MNHIESVRAYLAANISTQAAVGEVLGIAPSSVRRVLMKLRVQGDRCLANLRPDKKGRTKSAEKAEVQPVTIAAAIASRTPLELVWAA